ncbi:hypothetical protein LXL04_023854 [Taraxacum kok-saghyz]
MDRSWMYSAPKFSEPFVNGVRRFWDFAFQNSSVNRKIACPCSECKNTLYYGRGDVLDHLITSGFRLEYSKWIYHGEGSTTTSSGTMHVEEELFHHDISGMLNDIGGSGVETHETDTSDQGAENGGRIFII